MSDIFFLVLRRLRSPLILLVCIYSVATLGLTLIPGMDDSGQVWNMSFFHAFYFVSFMGTTIGFGEIPYAFTDGQRAWVLVCIYISVIAWLYAIGRMLSLVQDTTFRDAISNRAFQSSINRIDAPFYIICGFGETGSLINRGLLEIGIRTVIIERDSERTNSLELIDLVNVPIVLTANAVEPNNLLDAGMNHAQCHGVIASTSDDHTNLQISLSCKLLNDRIPVICRSQIEDEANNMASFGTDEIINPYIKFAKQLSLLAHNPQLHRIQTWFINQHNVAHITERRPPLGRWIICGYGRLGKAIYHYLQDIDDIQIVVVDAFPETNGAPAETIVGRGTEANTLHQAGILEATVVIAASDDDANNLSILMTAQLLNQDIYTIGRISHDSNEVLFKKAKCDYLMQVSHIISNEVITLISRPLVTRFIQYSNSLTHQEIESLISDINQLAEGYDPITWRLIIDQANAPALLDHLEAEKSLNIGKLCQHSAIPKAKCIPLLLQRRGSCHLLPDYATPLQPGDELLFCGNRKHALLPQRLRENSELIDSLINKNPYHIPVLRWLARRRSVSL